MDEMKIRSNFSKLMMTKFLNRILEKKFGPGIRVDVKEFEIRRPVGDACDSCYELNVNGAVILSDRAMEDLICKKRSGSGTS